MPSPLILALAWILALALDLLVGEYPNRFHPVVWIGRTISWGERIFLGRGARFEFMGGLLLTLTIPAFFAGAAYFTIQAAEALPIPQLFITTFWLKASFAWKALGGAAENVHKHLEQGNVDAARFELRALCSRNASQLNEEELTEAAISSLAENLSDSVIAPWFFAVFFGVPGAVFYRAVNTMDAMIGYKNHYKNLGCVAARTDDVLNYIPARITVLFLLAARSINGRIQNLDTPRAAFAWSVARRDHALTPSPNGGWPMATMAGMLGIQLRKTSVYTLGQRLRPSTLPLIHEAWRFAEGAAALAWPFFMAAALLMAGLWA
ncbi:MAG TPA: adenosylcobinamide-phosphate synthase CbiB [Oligoflexus sp.]|uniref:adenosylcobinamide-phosphate synthase CbiB n=1 Tax=Oligoflexus sp. TaxID=1971216 RepID=UPI002D7FBD07|nr:adenosylcobinamide-phosphate synthase CbiB [Oligoflexus sp.]HET9240927.1 adenosylcobinamide-phosphate synthase CbiB [Oligoflexus sp.]